MWPPACIREGGALESAGLRRLFKNTCMPGFPANAPSLLSNSPSPHFEAATGVSCIVNVRATPHIGLKLRQIVIVFRCWLGALGKVEMDMAR
jgi:hypothetical protein